ncbi:zinc-dependent alcohol dehydrogenase family protein [Maribellus maritimus]|uniref:zinc-dependent alcohol dehydrogenase family protein n=1 Tax=Maribellus maritimus TaxID=2870838 RepID=UPI001EEB080F|nr:zinc-dependent alcohol dehydrogenase family protein [Maribellus maritimus]MCG6189584.1 zinc-dependent alcohol dehydrogenase family protein [Maribellus maritimus]
MKAWVINKISDLTKEDKPLQLEELPKPVVKTGELLIRIRTCGVCHTEIDEIEGRTPPPKYPVIPGHQVIGTVEESESKKTTFNVGDRVGVAWIFSACGTCEYCLSGQENLCPDFQATGRDTNGGYAEYMVVPEKYVYPIPEIFSDAEAAPLLCAGAIGYRSVALCNLKNGGPIGLTGFGASAHLVLKLLKYRYPKTAVYVFARNSKEREFALELGAKWAGNSTERPPELLNSIIDTTPVWKTAISALEFLKPGGRLVINAIRKESTDQDFLSKLDYQRHLWMEKEIKSVANVTSYDVKEFIKIAAEMPFKPHVEIYPFEQANKAIMDIKNRKIRGAKVLQL